MPINLIIQSYDEKNEDRIKELDTCLEENLKNPFIKKIYDLTDKPNLKFIKNDKYIVVPVDKWLTYKMTFEFANTIPNEYFALINNDIILDPNSNWDIAEKVFLDNKYILAQSRHEYDITTNTAVLDVNFSHLFHAHTQDGWFFKTPLIIPSNIDCDFEIGLLGCDNAIAERIYKSGYNIINKPIQFKIFHLDIARGKTSSNFKEVHNKKSKIENKHPEEKGCFLLPNLDIVSRINMEDFCKMFQVSPIEKYRIMCEIMNSKIKINNR